jgi:tetratricopeptide (TPR) repeat protein
MENKSICRAVGLIVLWLTSCAMGAARIKEARETIRTYPFSDPDPVPILVRSDAWERNARLYPYHFYDGYSKTAAPQDWTVVRMENPYVKLAVLPEVGGKIWGASEKSTGQEFIYMNDVLKFRQVALRGPWTSGGVEFNFGLVGHAPSCATPVDYLVRKNTDGSVSCIVGTMDLPSRTRWAVTITLAANKALVETRAFWYNPTPLNQSYYVWMNGAVQAAEDLQHVLPGTSHIGHNFSVDTKPWPVNAQGQDLSWYCNNRFGSHKSYFTVGEYENFYGGYWHQRAFGFGHWALYDDIPGQKLWLWALSRQGGIWEGLLTDRHGQYVEPQAGRYFNQNDHAFFAPHTADTWRELWFPYKQIGPLAKASPEAVLSVTRKGDGVKLGVCALEKIDDTLVVTLDEQEIFRYRLKLSPMAVYEEEVPLTSKEGIVEVKVGNGLRYSSDPAANQLQRPIDFHEFGEDTNESLYLKGQRLETSRRYSSALEVYRECLQREPDHMRALCRVAELYCRRGEYKKGLGFARKALHQEMYDPAANYIYGILSRRLGNLVDAKETLGWAARSMQYRSTAYCQLAEIHLLEGNGVRAIEYARRALDYNRYNINAYQLLAATYRSLDRSKEAREVVEQLIERDPLNHYARFEQYLQKPSARRLKHFQSMIRNEFPAETYIELAVYYASIGLTADAVRVLEYVRDHPTACYWLGYLLREEAPDQSRLYLEQAGGLSAHLVFPFRAETIPVLEWAIESRPADWKTSYYLGLLVWSKGRTELAWDLLTGCGTPDFSPLYIARAHLNKDTHRDKALADFKAAVEVDRQSWRARHHLIGYYLEQGRTADALVVAQRAAAEYPDHMVVRIDLVRALVKNTSWKQALDILDKTSTLPFEGAREVHDLYVTCQVQLALQGIMDANYALAVEHLEGSKQYPERLGTGRPYGPDLRMQDFLLALCHDKLNQADKAQAARKAVYDYTLAHMQGQNPNHYFGALVLEQFGVYEEAAKLRGKGKPSQQILDAIRLLSEVEDTGAVSYGVGAWDANSLGNHRVVLEVTSGTSIHGVHVPWRRRDRDPQMKKVIFVDAATGQPLKHVCALEVNREFGDFAFEPLCAGGQVYLYYLPHEMTGRHYPTVVYPEPDPSPDSGWLAHYGFRDSRVPRERWAALPKAKVVEIQSIDAFNSFYPMEVIATAAETEALVSQAPQASYLLFPEDREHPIRMTEDLPQRWIEQGPRDRFQGEALRGEFYAFQVGVYACQKAIDDIDIQFSDLQGLDESRIDATALRCFNVSGVDWQGRVFDTKCGVKKGQVRALWFGIAVGREVHAGCYNGQITITPRGGQSTILHVDLTVQEQVLDDAGDSQPWRHSRLRWLDSTIALDNEIVEPFVPLTVEGQTIRCLGRSVTIDDTGLPRRIQSRFAPEVTHLMDQSREVLSGPVQLIVENGSGKRLAWDMQGSDVIKQTDGVVTWESRGTAGALNLSCQGRMEFDGFVSYTLRVSATQATDVNDIRLEIPVARDVAKYIMGMGLKGGLRPAEHHWQWDQQKNHDSVWVGDTNAGLQCALWAENYSRPLNTNFYLLKPLNLPPSWYNQGKGGCHIGQSDAHTVLIRAHSGARTIRVGETLHFNFTLLLTPFKTLDIKGQWATRFYHSYKPVAEIAETGANTVNMHHANDGNPYINYPFIHTEQMKAYVEKAHEQDLKVKIYYTVRELSNRCPELFALRSLDHEILSDGPGGGFAWLQEHLGSDYIAGWYVPRYQDAAVINSGVSRWHNYYLEGLNWLVENIGIDGLYIDDVAFDRTVMQRLRKILDRSRPGALIDLHSANQYNVRDGFVNSANLYLEHFPYINRLWFGEYFDYNSAPDFWLVEVSGICFGLMGEMLQDGGNPWRGMLYGMTARMPREDLPGRLWQLWDDFGMQEAKMIGYWSDACPVTTAHPDVLATVYQKSDSALISLASWASEPVSCRLKIDWDALGMSSQDVKLTAPRIEEFQESAEFRPGDEIPIAPGKGWLLILSR